MHIIDKLADVTSRKRTIPPRSFTKHDTFSALAVSMTVPINIVTRFIVYAILRSYKTLSIYFLGNQC